MTPHRTELGMGADRATVSSTSLAMPRRRCGDGSATSSRDSLEAAIERADHQVVHLVVVGQFKRGKTTLINALLGVDLLPRAVTPLTSVITLLRDGPALRATVVFQDGLA